jgi:hypothetical protein
MISVIVGFVVDQMPFLIMCMCPIVVDINFGRCILIALLVRPGNDVSQSLSIAWHSVFTGRDPIVALRYAMSFAIVGWWYALFAACVDGTDGNCCAANRFIFLWCLIGIIHRVDILSLMPFNIILSFLVTTILSFVKLILQPSSANSGIDSSGVPFH